MQVGDIVVSKYEQKERYEVILVIDDVLVEIRSLKDGMVDCVPKDSLFDIG